MMSMTVNRSQLAYALLEGAAEIIEIPSTDLSATVVYRQEYPILPIVLYDNVPGGTGLVARLEKLQEPVRASIPPTRASETLSGSTTL